MIHDMAYPGDIWRLHDFLSEKREEIDEKAPGTSQSQTTDRRGRWMSCGALDRNVRPLVAASADREMEGGDEASQ